LKDADLYIGFRKRKAHIRLIAVSFAKRTLYITQGHMVTLEHVFKEITVPADQYGPPFNQGLSPRTARGDECHKNVKAYQRGSGQQSPVKDFSSPLSPFETASLSSITTKRSKGVNWPTVRWPETRTSTSSTPYTSVARSGNSHQGPLSSNMATHQEVNIASRHSSRRPTHSLRYWVVCASGTLSVPGCALASGSASKACARPTAAAAPWATMDRPAAMKFTGLNDWYGEMSMNNLQLGFVNHVDDQAR
jgi:hypothetical protein